LESGNDYCHGFVVEELSGTGDRRKAEIKKEAQQMLDWASKASREEVEAALMGEGSSSLATTAQYIKKDEFWMYSRYFGIGLLKIMECIGIEMDKDEVYPIMEDWMSNKLGRSHLTACVSAPFVDVMDASQ
jgi:hypothetical protein